MSQALTFEQLSPTNSISTRLFRNVFLIYFVVIILLTGIQMMAEYRHVQQEIYRELAAIETTVEPQLARALSVRDFVKISSTLSSLSRLPVIEGITVEDDDGHAHATSTRELWDWKQSMETSVGFLGRSLKPYQGKEFLAHRFVITDPVQRRQIGKGIIYISDDIVWHRVKYGFQLIIVNSILKTIALWIIFLFLSRIMLAGPLRQIVGVIRKINMDNLKPQFIDLNRKHKDELTIIETALKEMVENLAKTQHEIREKSLELLEKNVQLEKVNQLKDEFLANTSHELRTPLHGIIGIARSLKSSLTDKKFKEARLHLNMIIQAGQHLSLLVDDILDFSLLRHQTLQLKLKPVDVRQVMRVVEQLSKPLISKKALQIANRLAPDLPYVIADEARLQQILQNLVGNAIKFSPTGTLSVYGDLKGAFVEISVSDTAEPIPDEKHEMIFEPFEQGDTSVSRQHGGAGLGLAIVKQLVELHGGDISIESKTGQGNIFKFTLPVADRQGSYNQPVKVFTESDDAIEVRERPIAKEGNENALIKILVVDDDPVNLHVVFNYLTSLRYSVFCTQGGEEALDWIANNGKPDLILLDIMMPRMNGFEVCRELRKQYDVGSLPIVFLTASHRRKDVKTGFSLGANDYLTKPFEKSELVLRIRVHLRLLLAKRQLQSLRDFANRISEFKDHGQLLAYFVESMIATRLVTDAVCFEGDSVTWKARETCGFLNLKPDGEHVLVPQTDADSELALINFIDLTDDLCRFYHEKCGKNTQGGHFALIRPECCRDNLIILYRTKERMPFNDLDVEYLSNLIKQLNTIERNIRSMLSDQLVMALPEIQPNLSRITHITAASPYCSVYLENEPVSREVRISLSSLDLYFSDEVLLRVHRSHLINPRKVTGIQKKFVGNKKYRREVTVENGEKVLSLRIGDSYVSKVRKIYPRFFAGS